MNSNKNILSLLSHISDGDYKKANGTVKQIIEEKIDNRISKISKTKKDK